MNAQGENSGSESKEPHGAGFKEVARRSVRHIELLNNLAPKHRIYGLVEIDVTKARRFISENEARTGEKLSFTGWVVKCVAQAVSEHLEVQGIKKGKKKLIIFDDVDVGIIVELEIGSAKAAIPYCIRKANERSYREIHDEIRQAQKGEVRSAGESGDRPPLSRRLFSRMPDVLRRLYWRKIRSDPFLRKRLMGTVAVTAVGMFGRGGGWAIPVGLHPLVVALGGISAREKGLVDLSGPGEFLSMTVMFDEEVSLGAPATRFLARLSDLMQSGYGLYE